MNEHSILIWRSTQREAAVLKGASRTLCSLDGANNICPVVSPFRNPLTIIGSSNGGDDNVDGDDDGGGNENDGSYDVMRIRRRIMMTMST